MLSTIICKDKKEFFKPFVEIKNGKIKTHKFTESANKQTAKSPLF